MKTSHGRGNRVRRIEVNNRDGLLRWLGTRELGLLVVILLIVGGIWAFVEIADEIMEEETHALDEQLIIALRNPDDLSDPIGPKWVEELGRDMTALVFHEEHGEVARHRFDVGMLQ